MRPLALTLILPVATMLACSHVQQAAEDVCKASPDLIKTVSSVLGDSDYDAELAKIATTLCALEDAVGQVTASAGVKATSETAVYSHGRAWLDKHVGAVLEEGQPPKCCFHVGGHSINTPACGNGVSVTLTNFSRLCTIHCLTSYFNCP